MARNPLAHACLLATLLVAGAMPTVADLQEPGPGLPDVDAIDEVGGYGPACSKSDDDAGTGGTQVSCKYSCGKDNLLAIGGSAADPDATAYGDTTCGGATAICRTLGNTCEGVSRGRTTQAQAKATCYGGSDEFWSSPMTIACASHGTDPKAIVCQLIEDLCDREPGDSTLPDLDVMYAVGDVQDQLLVLCAQTVADVQEIAGFVVAFLDGEGFISVEYDPAEGCQVHVGDL